jgi:hypothetical protein
MKEKNGRRDVSHLLAALTEMSAPGHSPLYLWLRQNHDEIVEGLRDVRPSWRILAKRLGEMGIQDGAGKTPTPEGARATWYRVRRDLAAARAKQAARPGYITPTLPGEIAPGVLSVIPPLPARLSPDEQSLDVTEAPVPPRPKLDIRPARPRSDVSAPPPTATSATSAAPSIVHSSASTEGQLRRVLDAMAVHTTPLPGLIPPTKKS